MTRAHDKSDDAASREEIFSRQESHDGLGSTPRSLLRHEVLRVLDDDRALRAGVRRGELERLHRGAYLAGGHGLADAARFRLRVDAYVRARRAEGGDPVLAGPAAVVTWDLPLWGRLPSSIHVTAAGRGGRATRGLATPVAVPAAADMRTWQGYRLVAPARSVLDTARLMSLTAGVVAADAALREGRCSASDLAQAVQGMARLKGVARSRTCLILATPLSESPGESWSAVVLHVNDVPPPQRQQELADGRGSIGRVDFWWPDRGVVGEFDGRIKYGRTNPAGRAPEDVLWAEKVREDRLRALGLTVVRWTTADLSQPDSFCSRLRRLLR